MKKAEITLQHLESGSTRVNVDLSDETNMTDLLMMCAHMNISVIQELKLDGMSEEQAVISIRKATELALREQNKTLEVLEAGKWQH